jgi:hypothetical protein
MSRHEDQLAAFVREGLATGATRPEIEAALRDAGWPAEQVSAALQSWSTVAFRVPVPSPRPYVSAREAFLYLVLYSTLFLSAYSLGDLLFCLIDKLLPYNNEYAGYRDDQIRWAIARLVVSTPVFLFTAHRVGRMLAADPMKRLSPVRKWLTYLALFVAVGIVIADIVTLVAYALQGDLSIRFVLKVVTVALIAAAIIVYYLRDLRRDEAAR